jgi:tRNA 2-selenouridine synthase
MKPAAIVADHLRVLRDRLPLIDLRAPAEFTRGAFAQATNLPLLTDDERAAVGTRYKECGQQAAITLGEELVSGDTREARIEAWHSFVTTHPTALLYCWRGGLRSAIAQEWLHTAGVDIGRIAGGYKALRQTCLNVIQEFCATRRLLVLGGRTGSGKTALLRAFPAAVDLEALAKHRGSAFGATTSPQPTPIGFENELAVELLNKTAPHPVLLEDESRTIGRLAVPEALHAAMQAAPIVVLDVPRSERAQHIFREYVEQPLCSGADGAKIHQRFGHAADRIRRRLGGVRHAAIRAAIDTAFAAQPFSAEQHLAWISLLLEWYYDPMYDHQLTAKQGRVVLRGDRSTVEAYLQRVLAE